MDQPQDVDTALTNETSAPFVGRWNHLISTTNWEKGRIIREWRTALVDADAPVSEYSDEAWARRVGNISPQHVGRLRRVYQRFGGVYENYPGLYWSHFQAGLDWHDAEMWLEGAVQNGWSISEMREKRWESIGAPADQKPREEDIITVELDEDVDTRFDAPEEGTITATPDEVRDLEEDIAADERSRSEDAAEVDDEPDIAAETTSPPEPVRPFENLPELPDDLNEAFEAFKLAILNHKLSGWKDISCQQVITLLEGLKLLALSPTE
jgi:hypothetical protein